MLTGPITRWRARVTYTGEPPIEMMPAQTNDPEAYEAGIRKNYDAADLIEVWEVDEHGQPIEKNSASEQKKSERPTEKPIATAGEETKKAKRPPGMAELFE